LPRRVLEPERKKRRRRSLSLSVENSTLLNKLTGTAGPLITSQWPAGDAKSTWFLLVTRHRVSRAVEEKEEEEEEEDFFPFFSISSTPLS
jgi:hypothetical protein